MLDNRRRIIDEGCIIADTGSGSIIASAAATVDGTAKVFDTGGGYTDGDWVVDISARVLPHTAASANLIEIRLEGSSTSTFTTLTRLASFKLGNLANAHLHTRMDSDSSASTLVVGRYIKPFSNEFPAGTPLRWLRVYTVFGYGATACNDSIKFKSWLSKR